ncbi:MAG: RNA-dependent RNA polymerase [Sanya aspivirus 1]|nr:MAG: RNA-dependent RNA polymerase [Sanya aspivirus 1]
MTNNTDGTLSNWAVLERFNNQVRICECIIDYSQNHKLIQQLEVNTPITPNFSSSSSSLNSPNDDDGINKIDKLETAINIKSDEDAETFVKNLITIESTYHTNTHLYALKEALRSIGFNLTLENIANDLNKIKSTIKIADLINSYNIETETLCRYCKKIGVVLIITIATSAGKRYQYTQNFGLNAIALHLEKNKYSRYCKPVKGILTNSKNHSSKKKKRQSSVHSVAFTDSTDMTFQNVEVKSSTSSLEMKADDDFYNLEVLRPIEYDTESLCVKADAFKEMLTKYKLSSNSLDNESIKLPKHFCTFLASSRPNDPEIEYSHPKMTDRRKQSKSEPWPTFDRVQVRMPKRLDTPLIRLPKEIVNAISKYEVESLMKIHNHHKSSLLGLQSMFKSHVINSQIPYVPLNNDINLLKKMILAKYDYSSKVLSSACHSFAVSAMNYDSSIVSNNPVEITERITQSSDIPSFLIMIQRLRNLLSQSEAYHEHIAEDYRFKVLTDGRYIMRSETTDHKYLLAVSGNFFYLWHQDFNEMFIGSMSYLDYTITFCETVHTLQLITSCSEYSYLKPLAALMLQYIMSDADHNIMVEIYKNFEPLMLMLSDLVESPYVNWTPIIDTLNTLIELSSKVSSNQSSIARIIAIIYNSAFHCQEDCFIEQLLSAVRHMSGNQLQEVSSMHKLIYYAEVDIRAGVNKYLKRVHTPRPVDPTFINQILLCAKRQFTLNYIDKHKKVPTFENENSFTAAIRDAFNRGSMQLIKSHPLGWWSDVQPYNCLSDASSHHALEVAKDKGALRDHIKLGPGDSRKELLQLIEMDQVLYSDLDLNNIPKPPPAKVEIRDPIDTGLPIMYPARLIPKEKEQKIEARLFGNTSLRNKHGLSFLMSKAKTALSYFNTEVMTKSDKTRKLKLHTMAQSLLKPENYAILLDIEGHNQSMQHHNCSDLYKFVGKLFGENNWDKLADYFSNLLVYSYDEYYTDVIASIGQLGGIEGWMNPLWTLHTSLIVDLLQTETTMQLVHASVYSDDVALIIRLDKQSTEQMNDLFDMITHHFFRGGMIVKMSQTAISKNRVTLLRSHYFKGKKSDSTLKRLLAVSVMNNGVFVSEELESDGICSSISSSLELSEHVLTATYLKWYRLCQANLRLFAAYFEGKRTSSLLNELHTPDDLYALLTKPTGDLKNHRLIDRPSVENYFKTRLAELNDDEKTIIDTTTGNSFCSSLFGMNPTIAHDVRVKDLVFYLMIEDDRLHNVFFLFLSLPKSIGGKGATLLINDLLSGHSEGFFKQIYYLHRWIAKFSSSRIWLLNILSNALRVRQKDIGKKNVTTLCKTTWAGNNSIKNIVDLIYKRIEKFVRQKCINRDICKLLDASEYRELFYHKLIETCGNELHPRILQFYAENSIYYLTDLLVRKIETSSGFCENLPNIRKLKLTIKKFEVENIITLFAKEECWSPNIASETDILQTLIDRRDIMLGTQKIITVNEPLYDHLLERTVDGKCTFNVVKSSVHTIKDSISVYKAPSYGNSALYRGELLNEESQFTCVEEYLIAKLCSVTKWMLTKLGIQRRPLNRGIRHFYMNMCDISLNTLCNKTYGELFLFVPLNTKGEVFHRIPNMRFKTAAVMRSLPNSIHSYVATTMQQNVNRRGLEDSNIHFDYITQRLRLAHAFQLKYKGLSLPTAQYYLLDNIHIHDVSDLNLYYESVMPEFDFSSYTQIMGKELNLDRIRQISINLSMTNDGELLNQIITEKEHEIVKIYDENIIYDHVHTYYRLLCQNYMSLSYKHDENEIWLPLISHLKSKMSFFNETPDIELIDVVKQMIADSKREWLQQCDNTIGHKRFNELRIFLRQDETNMEILADSYIPLIKEMCSTYGSPAVNVRENVASMTGTPLIMHIISKRNELARAYIKHLLIEYFIECEYENRIVKLSKDKSISAFLYYFDRFNLRSQQIVEDYLLYDVLLRPFGIEKISEMVTEIVNELSDKVTQFEIPMMELSNTKLSLIPTKTIMPSYTKPELLEMVEYQLYKCSDELFSNGMQLVSIFKHIRKINNLFSHPVTQWSPTGSDSYCSQYALFKALRTRRMISKMTKICDLTAGRGDGKYALNDLGMSCDSYSKRDIFTCSYHHPDIRYMESYDIFDPSTLDFVMGYEWVHIDVSFTGVNHNDPTDLLKYLMQHKKLFSIRLNSLNLIKLHGSKVFSEMQYGSYLTVPFRENLTPYQIYLIAYPSKIEIKPTVHTIVQTSYYQALIGHYRKIATPSNLFYESSIDYTNSIAILIGPSTSVKTLCEDIMDDNSCHYAINRMKRVLKHNDDKTKILIPSSLQKRLVDATGLYNSFIKIEGSRKVLTKMNIKDVGGTSLHKQKYWRRLINEFNTSNFPKYELVFDKDVQLLLECLQYDHPDPQIRGLCSDYLYTMKETNNTYPIDVPIVIEKIHGMMREQNDSYDTRLKHVRAALALIYYCSRIRSYKFGLFILWFTMRTRPSKMNYALKCISAYKKLGGIYCRLIQEDDCSYGLDKLFRKIYEMYVKPILQEDLPDILMNMKHISNLRTDEDMDEADLNTLDPLVAAFRDALCGDFLSDDNVKRFTLNMNIDKISQDQSFSFDAEFDVIANTATVNNDDTTGLKTTIEHALHDLIDDDGEAIDIESKLQDLYDSDNPLDDVELSDEEELPSDFQSDEDE